MASIEKRIGRELSSDHFLAVELAKVTKHHEEGRIWRCEVNLALPHEKRTLYVGVLSESLEAAIDEAKDELEREIGEYKEKRLAKFLKFARKFKDRIHIARLAQNAGDFYRWLGRR